MDLSMTNPKTDAYLIIDAGGTYLKSAILDKEGGVYPDSSLMTKACSEGSREEILEALREVIVKGLDYIKENNLEIKGIAMDFPGPFDYFKGYSMMDHKFKNIKGVNLREFIQGIPGVLPFIPVEIRHDANSAVAGEQWKGNAEGYRNVAVVTLGTGLGFAFSVNNKVQCNALGGPLVIIYNLPYRDGILEDYVSRRGFIRIYKEKAGKEEAGIDVVDIAKKAESGDNAALETFREVGGIIAKSLKGILEERQIECLLFGGQISRAFKYMEESLKEGLKEVTCLQKISVVKSIENAALLGLLHEVA